MKTLELEGLIERERRVIRFPDWQKMRDVGDFSARYLHIRDGIAHTLEPRNMG